MTVIAGAASQPTVNDEWTSVARKPSSRLVNAGECRALVPVSTAVSARAVRPRTAAAFLTQLIATQQRLPQARDKRRLEPEVVAAIYASALVFRPAPARVLASV